MFAEPLGTQPTAEAPFPRLPEPACAATTANRQFAKVPADLGRAAAAKLKPGGGAMTIPGLSYTLGRTLYVALTNRCNSVPLFSTRGPGFQMPAASGFAPLPDGVEPSAEQVAEAVAAAADVDAVCFAGVGEPLMKLNVLEAAAKLVRAERPALALRCNTNGLVQETVAQETAERLATAGLGGVSVALASADAAEYAALMEPEPLRFSPVFSLKLGHSEVCGFARACVAAGLEVECTAVAAPGVDLAAARALSEELGAKGFRERSWHE